MPETHVMVGKYWQHGIQSSGTNATVTCGSLSPNLQSARVVHNLTKQDITDAQGRVVGLVFPDDYHLELTFDCIPEDASSVANALTSAALPAPSTRFVVANMPSITIHGVSNALNYSYWIYEGGGTINMQSKEVATMTLPLHRYKHIAS